jgi:transposase, IS5 family
LSGTGCRGCGSDRLGPEDRVPDANTLWDFREALVAANALDDLFDRLGRAITAAGYLPRGGQIVDAGLVAAPRQRNTEGEKAAIKEGKSAAEIWPEKPAKARQKDVDGRWTVKYSKAKVRANGTKPHSPSSLGPMAQQWLIIAIPVYGYKSHISIDRMHGLANVLGPLADIGSLRRQTATDAARHDGGQLREGLIARSNTSRPVRAGRHCRALGPSDDGDAYRSAENEDWLEAHGMVSRIHRRKARGRPMPKRTRRANAAKSAVRSKVEHVFAQQKARMGMTIRTIGLERARATITLANMAFNMTRWRWLDSRLAPARPGLAGDPASSGASDGPRPLGSAASYAAPGSEPLTSR